MEPIRFTWINSGGEESSSSSSSSLSRLSSVPELSDSPVTQAEEDKEEKSARTIAGPVSTGRERVGEAPGGGVDGVTIFEDLGGSENRFDLIEEKKILISNSSLEKKIR